ncbi:hypothetical protein [Streptomyces sp. NPDC048425]|uniref:hypothetical protein n=1 Tax=Streptomyces sp. NPDC048425 TaxID=3365548 RepID=UPI00372425EC
MTLGAAIVVLSDRKTTGTPPLPGGIHKVRLDCKVKASLADSTAQIGALQVLGQGRHIDTGVQVAMLDAGVDTDHPDLEERNVSRRTAGHAEEPAVERFADFADARARSIRRSSGSERTPAKSSPVPPL